MFLNIYYIAPQTSVLGPGMRFALWLQGCKKRCVGCIAADAQSGQGDVVSVEDIFSQIIATPRITGITISGGEPFDQSESLSALIKLLKAQTGLDIIIFTGYLYSNLRALNNVNIQYILNNIDLLIDGE